MDKLLEDIKGCQICSNSLPHAVNPVITASVESRVAIIGQAPGSVVHKTGIPWDDKSGDRLREWMGVSKDLFYDTSVFALIPMGFCYPGKGKTGDLPPRKECAPQWHKPLFDQMRNLELILLIGSYAQKYYLEENPYNTLTKSVENYKDFLPKYFVLPHPSPRNNIWLKKNIWFEKEVIPSLKDIIASLK